MGLPFSYQDFVAALAEIVNDFSKGNATTREHLTKFPMRNAVGHGRNEPLVLLRFEDDPAYGLSRTEAINLSEALLEERKPCQK